MTTTRLKFENIHYLFEICKKYYVTMIFLTVGRTQGMRKANKTCPSRITTPPIMTFGPFSFACCAIISGRLEEGAGDAFPK